MKKKKILLRVTIALLVLFTAAAVMAALMWYKIVKLNHPKGLKGADVSSYQGQTDWAVLSGKMDFVFVKATEGSAATDEMFLHNFTGAMDSGLYTGAYHFFSFDSPGSSQAENFIAALDSTGRTEGMLPPVIDVELYGDHRRDPKPAEEVVPELREMVGRLEAEYGMKPIFYATGSGYRLYVRDNFPDCGLWIRDVYTRPSGDSDWVFWQYSGTDVLDGYNGEEKYIDRNVFRGTRKEFEDFCAKSSS